MGLTPSPDYSSGLWVGVRSKCYGVFWWWRGGAGFCGVGRLEARLAGRVAGGSTGPGVSLFGGTGGVWSGWVREVVDACPGAGDVGCPGPGSGDFQVALLSAVGQSGGGVEEAVAQGLGFGAG